MTQLYFQFGILSIHPQLFELQSAGKQRNSTCCHYKMHTQAGPQITYQLEICTVFHFSRAENQNVLDLWRKKKKKRQLTHCLLSCSPNDPNGWRNLQTNGGGKTCISIRHFQSEGGPPTVLNNIVVQLYTDTN